MKKLGYVFAALATLAIAAPSIANAETFVIKRGGHDHFRGARAEHRDHGMPGWHRGGWHRGGNKVVIIKHRRHGW